MLDSTARAAVNASVAADTETVMTKLRTIARAAFAVAVLAFAAALVLSGCGVGGGDTEMFSEKTHEQSLVANLAGESKLNCA